MGARFFNATLLATAVYFVAVAPALVRCARHDVNAHQGELAGQYDGQNEKVGRQTENGCTKLDSLSWNQAAGAVSGSHQPNRVENPEDIQDSHNPNRRPCELVEEVEVREGQSSHADNPKHQQGEQEVNQVIREIGGHAADSSAYFASAWIRCATALRACGGAK